MADIELGGFDQHGAIGDLKDYTLPPEAFTLAENVRFLNGRASRMEGHSQIFGTPGVAPHYALPISGPTQTWWLYTSLTKAYVYDGSTHTDITRAAGGDYTAAATRDWNGTILGGIPILNSGSDVPQYWASYSAAQKLQALSNWTSTHRCRVIRALGPILVAGYITKGASVFPHLIKTSHPADPGSLPSSWDEADDTKDTTEKDLPDVESGMIVNMLPLRGNMYIYKEGATWRQRYIGGRFIFAYDEFLVTSGILAPRCATYNVKGDKQAVWTQDDIIIHNGQAAESILERKWRKTLFNRIDTQNYLNCFTFTNAEKSEIWFCFPESGQTNPNLALVWNIVTNTFNFATVKFRNAAVGTVETADTATWASGSNTWASTTAQWSEAARRKVVLCDVTNTKFHKLNSTSQHDGTNFTATLQRTGLAVTGRKRSGEWIVDYKQRKLVTRVWIRASGGPINVRMGSASLPDGGVTWTAYQSFDPSSQLYLDFSPSGQGIAIEFQTTGNVAWEIEGYKIELFPAGVF